MKNNNQTINCMVESCNFHKDNICTLKEILISSINNHSLNTTNEKETLCKSFEFKNK